MSQENVEIVRRAIAAANRRDVDGYLSCCTEDVRLCPPNEGVLGTSYEGPDGIRRYFADIDETGRDFTLTVERLEAVGAHRVLAFLRVTVTGRASGVSVEQTTGNVYDLVNGRIESNRIFLDRTEALEAAGLSE
jgi:ketosteroid isomerase-like protein